MISQAGYIDVLLEGYLVCIPFILWSTVYTWLILRHLLISRVPNVLEGISHAVPRFLIEFRFVRSKGVLEGVDRLLCIPYNSATTPAR
jgi:hypothetical protein